MGDHALSWIALPGGRVTVRDARRDIALDARIEPIEIAAASISHAVFTGDQSADHGLPATGVTWFDAVEWCNRSSESAGLPPAYSEKDGLVAWDPASTGYRLPTVAEWEYACRAGTPGPTYGRLKDVAWSLIDDVMGPQTSGGKLPNSWGLYDTLGNVWEWCWDYADPARYGAYRTLKGGGWADEEWNCRVGVRRASAPDAVLEDVGFRVVRGAVTGVEGVFQGWSPAADRERAGATGLLPVGWTPLRELLD